MLIPVVTSLIFSAILLGFTSVASDSANFNMQNIGTKVGAVKGAIEVVLDVPEELEVIRHNKLPLNIYNNITPQRIAGSSEFSLKASSAIVFDAETKVPLWEKRSQNIRPIASITKLMTALVFLENNPGWDSVYEVKRADRREGGRIYIFPGEKIKVRDLFYLSLVGSANTATMALVSSTGLSEAEFVDKMNAKAEELGLVKTSFADPVGLSSLNTSTAMEVAKLAQASFSQTEIASITLKEEHDFQTEGGKDKRVTSTDKLPRIFPNNGISMLGGKTGYTDLAGFCFVGQFVDKNGRKIISVILGADSLDSRFTETKKLVEWTFASYNF